MNMNKEFIRKLKSYKKLRKLILALRWILLPIWILHPDLTVRMIVFCIWCPLMLSKRFFYKEL